MQTQEQAVADIMLKQEKVTSQVESGQEEKADKVEDRVLKVAADAFGADPTPASLEYRPLLIP